MDRFFDRLRSLEALLWILASALAFVAFLVWAPAFFNPPASTPSAVAKGSVTPRPTLTLVPTATNIPAPPAVSIRTAIPAPTLAPNAKVFTFVADSRRSGWLTDKETLPHWNDRNLHAGAYKGQIFQSFLYFDLSELAPGSKILFAQVELYGLSRNNLGASGVWSLRQLPSNLLSNWMIRSSNDLREMRTLADIGMALKPEELAEGQANQFIFAPTQLSNLEGAVNGSGHIAFRLEGPSGLGDNLFTWDGGDPSSKIGVRPTLRLIAIPEEFVPITQTPTPQNVLTAAAIVAQGTESARLYGTPTLLPRKFATALPLVLVTPVPTPLNLETAAAHSFYATAVAMTTGTFTPTPPNWIVATAIPSPTATPLPAMIPVKSLTPLPTPTTTPTSVNTILLAKQPIPPDFYNKILFQSGPREAPQIWVIDPDGKNLGLVPDRSVYARVAARDAIDPNFAFLLYNAPDRDNPDTLQIWIQTLYMAGTPPQRLTAIKKGVAYAPAWAPFGNKFAYVSQESGRDEIWIFDLETKKPQQLTFNSNQDYFWNQFPSWSPDGKRIAFSSDRGHIGSFTEIWTMSSDGTGEVRLGDGTRDAWAPIWVKWKR